ncbi:hypothetical protein RRG08_009940 [Elysia crispata]|uniref:Secreted protein n=1 Tax=Elysia crispata TaxID=231223 RepID=A0AAE1ATL7_9GAST|nr:hypothetical protein RRG08_009940 [Elysia crispata]
MYALVATSPGWLFVFSGFFCTNCDSTELVVIRKRVTFRPPGLPILVVVLYPPALGPLQGSTGSSAHSRNAITANLSSRQAWAPLS